MHAVITLTFKTMNLLIREQTRQFLPMSNAMYQNIYNLSYYRHNPGNFNSFFHMFSSIDHIILFQNSANELILHVESTHATNVLERLKDSVDRIYNNLIYFLNEANIETDSIKAEVEVYSDSYSLFVGRRKTKIELSWSEIKKDKLKLFIIPISAMILGYSYHKFDKEFNFKSILITGIASILAIVIALVFDFFSNEGNKKFIYTV